MYSNLCDASDASEDNQLHIMKLFGMDFDPFRKVS